MDPDPAEENISNLLELGVVANRNEAIARLKANGNDLERTINAIFDNPSTAQNTQTNDYSWDERQFHQGKDGYSDTQNQCNSEILQPTAFAAPSRPPSRVNDRGVINLAEEHARADPKTSMSVEDRDQHDIQKALELSMNPQESGVTSNVHFGPATREHYDSRNWALTTQASAHEIILDPDPADRKRKKGEPAFLKPSPSGPHLASLLTILHSIPLGREVLLLPNHLLADYGYDREWWSGSAVKVSRVIDSREQTDNIEQDEVIHETQRLMAFLDMTDRSYGSVDALLHLSSVEDLNLDMVPSKYLDAWSVAIRKRTMMTEEADTFRSIGVRKALTTNEEQGRQVFSILELPSVVHVDGANQTLYEAMDDLIWDDSFADNDFHASLEVIGDIFCIISPHATPGRGLKVPAVWYPDRYLEASQELASELRARKAEANEHIRKLEQLQSRLTSFKPSGSNSIDPRKLLEGVLSYLETPESTSQTDPTDQQGSEVECDAQNPSQANSSLVAQLRRVHSNVTEKLQSLDQQIKDARATLRDTSSYFLTQPAYDPKYDPHYRYTLRGVGTESNITYLLRPIEEGDTDHTVDALSRGEQWWRVVYSTAEANPVKMTASPEVSQSFDFIYWNEDTESWSGPIESDSDKRDQEADMAACTIQKVSELEVLKAAKDEGKMTLLVYANEKATDKSFNSKLPGVLQVRLPPPSRLGRSSANLTSPPTQDFVRADNASFAAELQETASASHAAPGPSSQPRFPHCEASTDHSPVRWGGHSPPPSYHDLTDNTPVDPTLPHMASPRQQQAVLEPKADLGAGGAFAPGATMETAVNLLDDDDDDDADADADAEGDDDADFEQPVVANGAQEMSERNSGNLLARTIGSRAEGPEDGTRSVAPPVVVVVDDGRDSVMRDVDVDVDDVDGDGDSDVDILSSAPVTRGPNRQS
ncbi:MAG: hypothetical protein M1837_006328 [Sclerophora amabilis]|nr:MAG: hypothetical protein M1837_006328 [Sclerophora amabilis]